MNNQYDLCRERLAEKPKRWLITGVGGFIGSNLLEVLLTLNQRVVGMDNFLTGHQANLDEVEGLVSPEQWRNFTFVKGDIRDAQACNRVCTGVDYVLHQAALGSVPRSIEDPIATNEHNLTGFLNMIVAARDADVERFVFATSSSVYGDNQAVPKVEDRIGSPLSPYALTKQVNEKYADIFSHLYGLKYVGLRYFNVFGPRQDPKGPYAAVIPKWFSCLINGEEISIYGDGETSRDFCFVENVVQANILAACTASIEAVDQIYNIACGAKTTLNELFGLIRSMVSLSHPEVMEITPAYHDFRPGDIRHSLANIDKARRLLGYDPQYAVKGGLERAGGWYLAGRAGE